MYVLSLCFLGWIQFQSWLSWLFFFYILLHHRVTNLKSCPYGNTSVINTTQQHKKENKTLTKMEVTDFRKELVPPERHKFTQTDWPCIANTAVKSFWDNPGFVLGSSQQTILKKAIERADKRFLLSPCTPAITVPVEINWLSLCRRISIYVHIAFSPMFEAWSVSSYV